MASLNIRLRPLTNDDMLFLRKVYGSTRQEELSVTGWPQEEIEKFLDMQFKAQHQHYMREYAKADYDVVLYNNAMVGRLYVDRRDDEIRIVDIALLPQFRGRGVGSYLLNQLLSEATANGLPVRIHVEQNNPAMRLYKRLGFVKVGENGIYHLMEKQA